MVNRDLKRTKLSKRDVHKKLQVRAHLNQNNKVFIGDFILFLPKTDRTTEVFFFCLSVSLACSFALVQYQT